MSDLPAEWVRDGLKRLAAANANVFGSESHLFRLAPLLPEADLRAFEERHRVLLPADYSAFLTQVGNGGAGPSYGVFPLGMWDGSGARLEPWVEGHGFWGRLAEPFPHVEAWNDTSASPPDALAETDPDAHQRAYQASEAAYWDPSRTNGAMPICHEGCAHRVLLVVTGAEAGHLWYDSRAGDGGLGPLARPDGSRETFASWYRAWLETELAALDAASPKPFGFLDRIKRRLSRA